MSDVGVTIAFDAAQVKREIDQSTKALSDFSSNLNVFNATAVKAFRESAAAEKELNTQIGATAEQTARLDGVIQQFENRVESASIRTGRATETMARGFAQVAASGNASVRSIDTMIAAGANMAFSFGPQGFLIASVLMATAGIVKHFVTANEEMEKTRQKFNDELTAIINNNDPVKAADAATKVYREALEKMARARNDMARFAAGEQSPLNYKSGDIGSYGRVLFGTAADELNAGGPAVDKINDAVRSNRLFHENDARLSELESDRKRLHSEIASYRAQIEQTTEGSVRATIADVKAAAERQLLANESEARRLAAGQIPIANRVNAALPDAHLHPVDIGKEISQEDRAEASSYAADVGNRRISAARKDAAEGAQTEARRFSSLLEHAHQISEEIFRAWEKNQTAVEQQAKFETEALANGEALRAQLQDRLGLAREGMSTADKQLAQAQQEFTKQQQQIEKLYEKRDAEGNIIGMNDAEIAQRAELLRLSQEDLDLTRKKILAQQAAAQGDWRSAMAKGGGGSDRFAEYQKEQARIYDDARKSREKAQSAGISAEEFIPKINTKSLDELRNAHMKLLKGVVDDMSNAFDRLGATMARAHGRGASAATSAAAILQKLHALTVGAEAALEAKKEGAAAIQSFAKYDYFGGALHLLSAAEFAATAVEAGVAAGSSPGGGGGGGGSGPNSSAAASLGSSSSPQNQTIQIEIVNVTKDQNGRETARTMQMIQRLNNLNQPLRVTL